MTRDESDTALHPALRALALHRAALRHDRHARASETALAHWARTHNLRFLTAARSAHPLARELRHHLHHAARARRRRDQLLPALVTVRASTIAALRGKLCVARIFVDNTPAAPLLASLARDLRRLH